LQQGLLDLGQLGSRQPWVRAGWTPAAQSLDAALGEAGVPDVRALARDTEGAGDLGLGVALGEQLGRLEPSGLKGGTLFGRAGRRVVGIAGRSHTTSPAVNPTHEPQIQGLGCWVDWASILWGRAAATPYRARGAAGGRSHSEARVGCIVWSTTASNSAARASRSTWSRSRTTNASTVRAASYRRRLKRRSTRP
jgi:hypothetical protein